MPINDSIAFLENLKGEFKKTISWNKYRPEIPTQPKNNNLDYIIDIKLRNINRLLVLFLENSNDNPTRHSFDNHYISLVEIKYFYAFIDNKPFFD